MNRSDSNFEYRIQRDRIGNDTLNHITIITTREKNFNDEFICDENNFHRKYEY